MRLSRNQKNVLKIIGICKTLVVDLIASNIIGYLKPKTCKEKYRYKKTINKLVDNDMIYLFGERIMLTEKGKKLIKNIELENITIYREKKWNNIWHLVCYDIPENKKKERDYFRIKLHNEGFKIIQDSLWVIPYECKEEIAVIAQSLGISPYVAYLNTDYLPQQQKLIDHFGLNINQDNG